MLVFHTHTCLLIACLHSHCMLAYSPLHIMLAYLHLHTLTLAYFALGCFRSSSVCVCKCECRSVSVEVSVFKGFSGRTLRNAFGNKSFGEKPIRYLPLKLFAEISSLRRRACFCLPGPSSPRDDTSAEQRPCRRGDTFSQSGVHVPSLSETQSRVSVLGQQSLPMLQCP